MAMDLGGGGGKPGKKKHGAGVKPTMNVTPLVDVVLVLLIIFMVITPLMTRQFWVRVPKQEKEETPPPDVDTIPPVVLTVSADGTVRLGPNVVTLAELPRKLKRVLAARPGDNTVFFDAEDDAPYATAMHVMDLARQGGATTIAVLPEKIQ